MGQCLADWDFDPLYIFFRKCGYVFWDIKKAFNDNAFLNDSIDSSILRD